jgi:hypothetical protein
MVASVAVDSDSDVRVVDDGGIGPVSGIFVAEDVQAARMIPVNIKPYKMTRLILSFLFLLH